MEKIKCVLVGDHGCGKTAALISFTMNTFPDDDDIPAFLDPYTCNVLVDGKPLELTLHDTYCSEAYKGLHILTYAMTDVFVLCFSVTSPHSFENISKKWYPEVHHYCPGVPIVLVGTKYDLINDFFAKEQLRNKYHCSPIRWNDGNTKAKEIGAYRYVECSALTQRGLKMVFDEAIRAVLNQKPPEKKNPLTRLFRRKPEYEYEYKAKGVILPDLEPSDSSDSSSSPSPPLHPPSSRVPEPEHTGPVGKISDLKSVVNPSRIIKLSDLEKGEQIGGGAFGIVFKGKYHDQDVAIKTMINKDFMNASDIKDFIREVTALEKARHETVVNLVGVILDEGDYSIVSEFCQFGSLKDAMKRYPEFKDMKLKMKCLVDASRAMEFLHNSGFMHRDLKPDNFLVVSLDPGSPVVAKLSDFGSARKVSVSSSGYVMTNVVGTPSFMPPEVLQRGTDYDQSVDVYSFSFTISFAFSGEYPFERDHFAKNRYNLSVQIISGRRPDLPESCPEEMQDLIQECWDEEPSIRPSFKKVHAILEQLSKKFS